MGNAGCTNQYNQLRRAFNRERLHSRFVTRLLEMLTPLLFEYSEIRSKSSTLAALSTETSCAIIDPMEQDK